MQIGKMALINDTGAPLFQLYADWLGGKITTLITTWHYSSKTLLVDEKIHFER
jgi:hypothetical protein